MGSHRICAGTTLLVIVGSVVPVIAAETEPPKPNPARPVNYIEWLNKTMGDNVKDNAYESYQAAYRAIQPFEGDWGVTGRKDFVLGEQQRSEIILQGGLYNQNKWTFRFDADYHFVFFPEGPFRFYPLAGFDFAVQNKNNRSGINLGGGMTIPLREQISAFIEAKYTFGDWDGFALTAGVYF